MLFSLIFTSPEFAFVSSPLFCGKTFISPAHLMGDIISLFTIVLHFFSKARVENNAGREKKTSHNSSELQRTAINWAKVRWRKEDLLGEKPISIGHLSQRHLT